MSAGTPLLTPLDRMKQLSADFADQLGIPATRQAVSTTPIARRMELEEAWLPGEVQIAASASASTSSIWWLLPSTSPPVPPVGGVAGLGLVERGGDHGGGVAVDRSSQSCGPGTRSHAQRVAAGPATGHGDPWCGRRGAGAVS
ncbi:hypothetical protein ACGFY7_26320 [Streptomyces prunicolor]|uniref:hypothetical protein n=1 Tax=Streptomyces prunicolor TaxID=67348 RepID=UPI00371D937D